MNTNMGLQIHSCRQTHAHAHSTSQANVKWQKISDRIIVTRHWRIHEGRGKNSAAMRDTLYACTHADRHWKVDFRSLSLSLSDYQPFSCCFLSFSSTLPSTAPSHLLTHPLLLMKCCIIRIADCKTETGCIGPWHMGKYKQKDQTHTLTHTQTADLPAFHPCNPILNPFKLCILANARALR